MRIALVIEELDHAGAERVAQRVAVGLARRGHAVFAYCLARARVPPAELAAAGLVVREFHSGPRDLGLLVRLARALHADRIDLVHAHSCAAFVWAWPAARLLRRPVVHVWHGWPLGRPARYHRAALRLAPWAAAVGVNSATLGARLPRALAARAHHLPNGVALPPPDAADARARLAALLRRPPRGPLVLSIANVRPEKDLCGLLHAFADVRRSVPTAELLVVGEVLDATYAAAVAATRLRLGLADCVHLPGLVPQAWRLLAGAAAFCLSSATESMPNVVLEAMHQGVPIVATAVGDVGVPPGATPRPTDVLRHGTTALLVPAGDAPALAAALTETLRDPAAAARRAAAAAREVRTRFSLEQMLARYEAFYAAALRGCAPARRPPAPRRPRILMLGPAPPVVGGMVTSITRLMESPLAERFDLVRLGTAARPPAEGSAAPTVLRVARAVARHCGSTVTFLRTLVRRRVDLVHIHTCSGFTVFRDLVEAALARALGRRVVLHIRGGRFVEFARSRRGLGGALLRWGLRRADAIIVLAAAWRRGLAPFTGRTPVFVVPNAAPIGPPPAPRHPRRPCRLLHFAPLSVAKGFDDLLVAAAQLRRQGLTFELIAAGPVCGASPAAWRARAAELGLRERVRFIGPVPESARCELLAAADVFVHASHNEGLPNAILEAAAAGLPVVATAVGALPEMAPPTGDAPALVPPRDPAALAAALEPLIVDPRRRAAAAAAWHAWVARHCAPAIVADRVAQVYEHALGHAAATGRATRPQPPRPAAVPPRTAAPPGLIYSATGVTR